MEAEEGAEVAVPGDEENVVGEWEVDVAVHRSKGCAEVVDNYVVAVVDVEEVAAVVAKWDREVLTDDSNDVIVVGEDEFALTTAAGDVFGDADGGRVSEASNGDVDPAEVPLVGRSFARADLSFHEAAGVLAAAVVDETHEGNKNGRRRIADGALVSMGEEV